MHETVVSPSPIGASRSLEWLEDDSQSKGANVTARWGVNMVAFAGSANTDSGGTGMAVTNGDGIYAVRPGGGGIRAQWQGSTFFNKPNIYPEFKRPVTPFNWLIGRWYLESLMMWDVTPPAGTDSGIAFANPQHIRMVTRGDHGIQVGNIGGVLSLFTRGPGGFEQVALGNAGPLNDWNKVRMTIRQPQPTRDLTLEIAVNDVTVLARTWSAGHRLPTPATGWFVQQVTHGVNTSYLYTRQMHMVWGPDISDL